MKIQLGADPEFFLRRKSDKVFVPATSYLGPNMETPYIPFFDGFQGEITMDSANDIPNIIQNTRRAMDEVVKAAESSGLEPVMLPAIQVSPDVLSTCPSAVFRFGCDPSVNAFTKAVRNSSTIKKLHKKHPDIMMAGGHIHMGMPRGMTIRNPTKQSIPYAAVYEFQFVDVIRMFETLGVSLLNVMEATHAQAETNSKRRLFYGLSGEYRMKQYGIEARSPSCAWMSSQELAEFMFSAAVLAFYSVYTGEYSEVYEKISVDDHIRAINSSDIHLCTHLFNTGFEVIRGALATGDNLEVGSECKYANIWDPFKLLLDKLKRGINVLSEYKSPELAWGLS